MSDNELPGIACAIGPMAAIALRHFEGTFKKNLPGDARRYLIRAFVAIESLPKDADAEHALLRDVLCKLRDEWQMENDQ